MTEAEWLAGVEPSKMLKWAGFMRNRKNRLFAVACCRCVWRHLIDLRSRHAVDVAERYADGCATDEELSKAEQGAGLAHDEMFKLLGKGGSAMEWGAEYAACANARHGAKNVLWMTAFPRTFQVKIANASDAEPPHTFPCTVSLVNGKCTVTRVDEVAPTGVDERIQRNILYCIFGNPFQPVTLNPAWLIPRVTTVAQSIYYDRAFARMPDLADALQEGGCDQQDLLAHCRGPGPHFKGCWVVDMVLGKG